MTGDQCAAPRMAVVGGGLAGMAAAVGLRSAGCEVTLSEARRYLGGRAASFHDAQNDSWVDMCQHVSMGCCTNLADFCHRTGIEPLFRRDTKLHFITPQGHRYDFAATRGLPAPLHLTAAFWGLKYLSPSDRFGIGRSLMRLARQPVDLNSEPTVAAWLAAERQSERAIEGFWKVVLVSALGESIERAGLAAARKVFVDGFFSARDAYTLLVPRVPLAQIYDESLRHWFERQQVGLRFGSATRRIETHESGWRVTFADGATVECDGLVVAVPWRQIAGLCGPELQSQLPWLDKLDGLKSSPISGIHLWYDRPITDLPHAVLLGPTAQWFFARGTRPTPTETSRGAYYYQVVVSASREMMELGQDAAIRAVVAELATALPEAKDARLLDARVVSDPQAVFSVGPGSTNLRPAQRTGVHGLAVAGDWTATGWPATMEGAVRSGYLAAESLLTDFQRPCKLLAPDLSRDWLARWLVR